MSEVIKLIENISTTGFIACFIFDIFLIILTHFIIKRNFGPYRWLITSFATSGIAFSAIEVLLTPILHNFNSGVTLFTVRGKMFGFPIWVMEIFLAIYCGFSSVTISFLAVQFVYRYFAIFSPHKSMYFKGLKIVLWVCYPLAFGALWAFSAYVLAASNDFSDEYFQDAIFEFYGENLTSIAYFASIASVTNGVNSHQLNIQWKSYYYSLIVNMIVLIQYIIIVFCGYYTNKEIKAKTSFGSATLRRLHHQFFRALIMQIITPSAILFFPITFILLIPHFHCDINFPTGIFVSLFTIYPAVDALILMNVVTEYSTAIKALSRRFLPMFHRPTEHSCASIPI